MNIHAATHTYVQQKTQIESFINTVLRAAPHFKISKLTPMSSKGTVRSSSTGRFGRPIIFHVDFGALVAFVLVGETNGQHGKNGNCRAAQAADLFNLHYLFFHRSCPWRWGRRRGKSWSTRPLALPTARPWRRKCPLSPIDSSTGCPTGVPAAGSGNCRYSNNSSNNSYWRFLRST